MFIQDVSNEVLYRWGFEVALVTVCFLTDTVVACMSCQGVFLYKTLVADNAGERNWHLSGLSDIFFCYPVAFHVLLENFV